MNLSTPTVLKIAVISFLKKKDRGMPQFELHELFADILATGLGFRYKTVPSVDGGFGHKLRDGNWTGMIGMILRGEVDLASCMGVVEERFQVLSFSFPHDFSALTFITHKPQLLPPTYAFLRPFTKEVWITLILSTLILPVIFYAYLRRIYKYEIIMFSIIGSLLRQSWTLKCDSVSKCTLQITWLVSSMLTTFAYSAVLLSFLTFPPRTGIRDIAELAKAVEKGTHQTISYKGASFPDTLLTSDDKSIISIGQNLKNQIGSNDMISCLEDLEKKFVFIALRNILDNFKSRYFVSKDDFYPMRTAAAFGKHFRYQKKLNDVIIRATETGLFAKAFSDMVFTFSTPLLINLKPIEDTLIIKPLTLSDLWGAFVLLAIGYFVAILSFLLETFNSKFLN